MKPTKGNFSFHELLGIVIASAGVVLAIMGFAPEVVITFIMAGYVVATSRRQAACQDSEATKPKFTWTRFNVTRFVLLFLVAFQFGRFLSQLT